MVEMSWFWFGMWSWGVAFFGVIAGFGLCAVLTMGKRADEAMADMRSDLDV